MTEDDCSGQSNSENREGIDEATLLITERPGLSWKASKKLELLWEKPYQDKGLVASTPEESFGFLRMNTGRRSLR